MEREEYPENERYEETEQQEEETVEKKGSKITFIVIIALLILILVFYFFLTHMMPDYMFNQGKKYYKTGNYEKALHLFTLVADARPYDDEPVYYQALTLSKMPPTYQNQQKLYEISQLADCDAASELAENVLENMRKDLVYQVGSNYADNILYDDILIRWNNSQPITYSISGDYNTPPEYVDAVREAVMSWQTVTNGEISFKETPGNRNANINITFVNDLSPYGIYDSNVTGKTTPDINNETLNKMDIYIKKTDYRGQQYSTDALYSLALHEVGHALGLGSHSADPEDVMYFETERINENSYRKEISERDLNTLRLLYKMIPDVIDKPIPETELNNYLYHYMITYYPGENYDREIQRLLNEIYHNKSDIVRLVDLAITYAYKHEYRRSNFILNEINRRGLVTNDLYNQFVVLYNLAANYYKLKEFDESSNYLSMAEHYREDLDTKILEAFLDVRFGRLETAKQKLKILLKNYPDNIDVALKLAEVYHIEKNQKMETETIDEFLKKNPKAIRDRRIRKYKAKKKSYAEMTDLT